MGFLTDTKYKLLSGSMEPAFQRGDLLFLTMPSKQRLQVGDITVYNVPGAQIPIVHRVIEAHDEYVGTIWYFLSKFSNTLFTILLVKASAFRPRT